MRIKVDIKVKLNEILRVDIEEKKRIQNKIYIAIKRLRIKFDIINK
jgi:hypothetical protein